MKFSRKWKLIRTLYFIVSFLLCLYFLSLYASSPRVVRLGAHLTRLDFKMVKIHSVWRADEEKTESNICLATQGSVDRIHWITEVIGNWQGPISLAVFVTSFEEWRGLNLFVKFYRRCNPLFKKFVSIHVAIPTATVLNDFMVESEEFQAEIDGLLTSVLPCSNQPWNSMSATVNGSRSDEEAMLHYPQNHMRNIAMTGCGTSQVFSIDIDIIPHPNAASLLNEFYNSEEAKTCTKCAYVVPTFEVDISQPYPETKRQLVDYWQQEKAVPFHFNIFKEGHMATDYEKWSVTYMDETSVRVSHEAEAKAMEFYEPFYISDYRIPSFEERFLGYGFTRSSQIKEAISEGWKFKVLTPIFGIHWGLQSKKTLISPGNDTSVRKAQTKANEKVFQDFLNELDFKTQLRSQVDEGRGTISARKK